MFSNGTEYHVFMSDYCFKCSKYKSDKEGIPYTNSCKIEKKISEAMFNPDAFPKGSVYYVKDKGYICIKYTEGQPREYKARKVKQIEGQIKLI